MLVRILKNPITFQFMTISFFSFYNYFFLNLGLRLLLKFLMLYQFLLT